MMLLYILTVLIGTVILTLCLYFGVQVIVSKNKAQDKKLMIFVCALLIVLVIPLIVGFIAQILALIGGLLAAIRDTPNQLMNLVPILVFLLMIILIHFFLDVSWSDSVWIGLIGLFFLYILLTVVPELLVFPTGA